MSVMIRLQNLPLSAKSGDIRHFFRGVHIPDGGVHIIGGEKGIAFIAFNSDEDARIGMRKDGWKLDDSRVKLYLSSRMEMLHEIEHITKYESMNTSQKSSSSSKWRGSQYRRGRDRSTERNMEYSIQDYPSHSSDEDSRYYIERRCSPVRSRSPVVQRSGSPAVRRSQSPRRKSPSLRQITSFENNSNSYADSFHVFETKGKIDASKRIYDDDYFDEQNHSRDSRLLPDTRSELTTSEEQCHLEERIVKALNTGFAENAFGIASGPDNSSILQKQMHQHVNEKYPKQDIPFIGEFLGSSHQNDTMIINNSQRPVFPDAIPVPNIAPVEYNTGMRPPNNYISPLPPTFPNQTTAPLHMADGPVSLPAPVMPAPTIIPAPVQIPAIPFTGYYVKISGLDPVWTISDLQTMLTGIFAPQENIRWEIDDTGFKTGTAFLKLMNREDFSQILIYATFTYNNRLITVSECPNIVYEKYFPPTVPPLPGQMIVEDSELYYKIKNLPLTVTHEKIMHFFFGFHITDLYLEVKPSDRVTGNGFVCFANYADYEKARIMDGKKLVNRSIRMMPISKQQMLDSKRKFCGLYNPNSLSKVPFKPQPAVPPLPGQMIVQDDELYYKMKNLPFTVTHEKIRQFFSGFHIADLYLEMKLSNKPTGNGFISFANYADYERARFKHGKNLGKRPIEMIFSCKQKMLDSKRKFCGSSNPNFLSTVPSKHLENVTSSQKQPLCAVIAAQPFFMKIQMLKSFCHEHGIKPDAIHVFINHKKKHSLARGFLEFSNIRDFDAFLKCHGTLIGNEMICIKQILYDEMTQILSTNKVKHEYCNNSTNLVAIEQEPEKAPCIYDPPDHNNSLVKSNTKPWHDNNARNMYNNPQAMNYINQSVPPPFPMQSAFPTPHGNDNFKKNLDKRFGFPIDQTYQVDGCGQYSAQYDKPHQQLEFRNHQELDDYSSKGASNKNSNLAALPEGNDYLREPVKFEVKIKQPVAKNTKADDAFDKTAKGEVLQKLTKLTPEKEVGVKELISNKILKQVKNEEDPETTKKLIKPSLPSKRKDDVSKKNITLSEKDDDKSRFRKYSKTDNPSSNVQDLDSRDRFNLHRRSHSRDRISPYRLSPSHSPRRNDHNERTRYRHQSPDFNSPREVVVEMSNVHPLVGGQELKDFFFGFDVVEDKMNRRYSSRGEPMGDIRVTFSSMYEAERAIKHLSGRYLNGLPVDMMVVD